MTMTHLVVTHKFEVREETFLLKDMTSSCNLHPLIPEAFARLLRPDCACVLDELPNILEIASQSQAYSDNSDFSPDRFFNFSQGNASIEPCHNILEV